MKALLIIAILLFTAVPVLADYTIDLKNESGTVLKTYNITTNQVAHLQKKAARTGKSVIKQFETVIIQLIYYAKAENTEIWARDNKAYIEEQARQE